MDAVTCESCREPSQLEALNRTNQGTWAVIATSPAMHGFGTAGQYHHHRINTASSLVHTSRSQVSAECHATRQALVATCRSSAKCPAAAKRSLRRMIVIMWNNASPDVNRRPQASTQRRINRAEAQHLNVQASHVCVPYDCAQKT